MYIIRYPVELLEILEPCTLLVQPHRRPAKPYEAPASLYAALMEPSKPIQGPIKPERHPTEPFFQPTSPGRTEPPKNPKPSTCLNLQPSNPGIHGLGFRAKFRISAKPQTLQPFRV